jgi:exopolysaccharide biosynthesis WecB/TagA/CpsF family protein
MAVLYAVDDYDVDGFIPVAAEFGQDKFGYVVTPNTDHLIRFHDEPGFRTSYADAAYILLDSRFLSYIFRFTKGIRTRVCTGSDLTARLFQKVIAPNDRIVLIGGTDRQAHSLIDQFGLKTLLHFSPPMGFILDPQATEACLRFVEEHSPFRFCFLAVGAPQQELLAQRLKARGAARGMALCIGASINFLTGIETRAPRWIQRAGLEWLFRLASNPTRLARRYLVRGPRVFSLLRRTNVRLRPAALQRLPATPNQPVAETNSKTQATESIL